ncbi:hypothetical protein ACVMAJ_006672 [Bradyrhizobium sp. USDA 4448]
MDAMRDSDTVELENGWMLSPQLRSIEGLSEPRLSSIR